MGNISIFNHTAYIVVTYLSLFLLFFASIYSSVGNKQSKGIWFLFWGLAIDFVSLYVSLHSSEVYARGGSVEIWVLAEMSLCLVSMLLLATASSHILESNLPDMPIISVFGILGLGSIIFFLYIFPNNEMIAQMRYIFPLAGFAYLSIGFWAQFNKKRSSGFIFAGIVTTMVTVTIGLKMLGIYYLIYQAWYIPSMTYILLSMALIMMKVDFFAKKYDESCAEVAKNSSRIEEIIKYSPFPIIISRLSDDRIILANSNAIKLFGIAPNELERYHFKDFFADSENRRVLNERLEKERVVQDFEMLVKTPTGNTPF